MFLTVIRWIERSDIPDNTFINWGMLFIGSGVGLAIFDIIQIIFPSARFL